MKRANKAPTVSIMFPSFMMIFAQTRKIISNRIENIKTMSKSENQTYG